jgi:hypothetical protein
MDSETARIWDVEYLVRDDILFLTVKITYSYSRERTLKITVETSNPASSQERILKVGPGTDARAIDFELKPPPLQSTWYATFTLYESDEKAGKMEVLHMRNVDLNLDEARLRGKLSAGLPPLLFVLSSAAVIMALLYLRRRRKKRPEKRKRTRR